MLVMVFKVVYLKLSLGSFVRARLWSLRYTWRACESSFHSEFSQNLDNIWYKNANYLLDSTLSHVAANLQICIHALVVTLALKANRDLSPPGFDF